MTDEMSMAETDRQLQELQYALRDGTDWAEAVRSARKRLREYAELLTSSDELVRTLEQTLRALAEAKAALDLFR